MQFRRRHRNVNGATGDGQHRDATVVKKLGEVLAQIVVQDCARVSRRSRRAEIIYIVGRVRENQISLAALHELLHYSNRSCITTENAMIGQVPEVSDARDRLLESVRHSIVANMT